MCDATHHKSFGSGFTAANEVHKRIVLYLTIKRSYIYCGSRLSDAARQMPQQSLAMIPPCCCYILYINILVRCKVVTARYVLLPQLQTDMHCGRISFFPEEGGVCVFSNFTGPEHPHFITVTLLLRIAYRHANRFGMKARKGSLPGPVDIT